MWRVSWRGRRYGSGNDVCIILRLLVRERREMREIVNTEHRALLV